MKDIPAMWKSSDKQIVDELGRLGWYRDAKWATKEERELALTQEALRRILKLLIELTGESKS